MRARRSVLGLVLAASVVVPSAQAQTSVEPEPICSFFVMMNVAVHHLHCSSENTVLNMELQTMLGRYANYISRNGQLDEAELVNSINQVFSITVDPDYDCGRQDRFVTLHDAFVEDPRRVQPTADLHLTVDRPVVLDVDVECTDGETG